MCLHTHTSTLAFRSMGTKHRLLEQDNCGCAACSVYITGFALCWALPLSPEHLPRPGPEPCLGPALAPLVVSDVLAAQNLVALHDALGHPLIQVRVHACTIAMFG